MSKTIKVEQENHAKQAVVVISSTYIVRVMLERKGQDMKIAAVSALLFALSIGFVAAMDWLVGIPLSVSIENMWLPFKAMMGNELVIAVIVLIFTVGYTAFFHRRRKR